MRTRAARTRDTLDKTMLGPCRTELDYRTCVTTKAEDRATVIRALAGPTALAAPVCVALGYLSPVGTMTGYVAFVLAGLLALAAAIQFVFRGDWTASAFAVAVLGLLGVGSLVLAVLPAADAAYVGLFGLAVVAAAVLSHFVAKQAAYWMTANPRIEHATVVKWRSYFPPSLASGANRECPEQKCVAAGYAILFIAFVFGLAAYRLTPRSLGSAERGMAALSGFFLAAASFKQLRHLLSRRTVPLWKTIVATFDAIRIFSCYNRHETPAPGVFRFPTAFLRPVIARQAVVAAVIVLAAFAAAAVTTRGPESLAMRPSAVPHSTVVIALAPHEVAFLSAYAAPDRELLTERLLAEKRARAAAQSPARVSTRGGNAITADLLRTIATTLFVPPTLCFAVLWVTYGSLLGRYRVALDEPGAYEATTLGCWDVWVGRMLNSEDEEERDHLLLGVSLYNDYPVLLHRSLLNQHGHITGDTGARKTALGIAPIATQLIAAGDCSVVVIDLKGEPSLFHNTRIEAERAGLPFRWFTTVPGHSSHSFNPLRQTHWARLSPVQRTQVLLQGLSLDYGLDYGKGFYTAMNETVLLNLIKGYPIDTFGELKAYLEDKAAYQAVGNVEDWKQARHLAALVNRLGSMHSLNLTPKSVPGRDALFDNAIDMADLFSTPQAVYFHLPSPLEPIGSPAVAKLAFYSLFTAAAQLKGKRRHVYVFIDEFQQVISDSVRLLLEQARSLGISLVLAHQTPGQLDGRGAKLAETVDSCTAFKLMLRFSDYKAMERIERSSGEAIYHRLSWSQPAPVVDTDDAYDPGLSTFGDVNVAEYIGNRIDRNTAIEVSAHPFASVVRFTEGSGYTQFSGYPTLMMSRYHISGETFKERDEMAWPSTDERTIEVFAEGTPASHASPAIPADGTTDQNDDGTDDEWKERLGLPFDPDQPDR
ncbi:MAG: type IV secretion system DNA-binding domain-containing protein [Planctomycetota bacterium]|nr:type IV secretion system DNA-binding domain-containing protein [Planctomycetota bacterium]